MYHFMMDGWEHYVSNQTEDNISFSVSDINRDSQLNPAQLLYLSLHEIMDSTPKLKNFTVS